MAALAFPSIVPEVQEFGIIYHTQVSSSPISGVTQTVELPGARWKGNLSFRDMTPSESADLKRFLLQMRGSAGRFYYGDLSHTTPFGGATACGTISASTSRRQATFTTTGASLQIGDYIQIGTDESRELKMITSAAGDNYNVEPFIRRTTYIGQSVTCVNPTGKFMLTSGDQANWAIRSKALLSDISLDFVEVY